MSGPLVAPSLAWPSGAGPGGLRQRREVLAAVSVQRGPSAEARPHPTDLLKSLGHSPFLKGLLADREQDRAAAGVLSAHNLHAPLVLEAGVIGARRAEEISVEVGEPVVAALDALDHIPPGGPATAPGTRGRLGPDHSRGRRVLTDLAGGRHVRASA